MVQVLKYLFLSLSLAVVVGLFLWEKDAGQIRLAAANMAVEGDLTADKLRSTSVTTTLEAPRYQGRDSSGQSWLVTADRALQRGSLKDGQVQLINANATYSTIEDASPITFAAGMGTYNRPTQDTSETLTLTHDVTVTGLGLTLHTHILTTNLNSRSISAPESLTLTGEMNGLDIHLTAGEFSYTPSPTEELRLTGGLKARLTPIDQP